MKSEVILISNEGESVPSAIAQKVLANNTSAVGVACIHPTEGFFIESGDSGATMKELDSLQNDFKANKVFYHFCESPEKVANEDLQPFRTVVDGKETKVVTFAVGAFEIENPGPLSDAHVYHETVLRPMVEEMYEASDKDLDKLTQMLKSKLVDSQMKMVVSPNKSTIAILLANGQNFMWTKADRMLTAPWGFTSDHFNVTEETPVTTETPKRRFGGGKEDASKTVPVDTARASTVPAVPAKPTTAIDKGPTTADLIASGAASSIPVKWCIPNPDMGARKTKDWYKQYNHGNVPDNWSMRPPIPLPAEEADKLSKTRTKIVDRPKEENTYRAFGPAMEAKKKDVETHHIPATQPIVSSVEATKKMGDILQAAKPVTDPKAWKDLENTYPLLHVELNIDETRVIYAPIQARVALFEIDKQKAARAWLHADYKRMEAVQFAQSLSKQLEELKKQAPAPSAEVPKVRRFGGQAA